jgi:hypothetical protein
MRIAKAATLLGILAACGKNKAEPPQVQPSASVVSQTATPPSPPPTPMAQACVKPDSEPSCPGFNGAHFMCPPGWTLTSVEASRLKQRCGPYEL